MGRTGQLAPWSAAATLPSADCRLPNSQVKSGQYPVRMSRATLRSPRQRPAPRNLRLDRTLSGARCRCPDLPVVPRVGVQTYLSSGSNRVNGLVRSGFHEQDAARLARQGTRPAGRLRDRVHRTGRCSAPGTACRGGRGAVCGHAAGAPARCVYLRRVRERAGGPVSAAAMFERRRRMRPGRLLPRPAPG
jgi:hypothetical protein